ncbi:MAG: sulfotransferase [Planctomycetota bacterium]|nr:sulfotransferase [Planctomycetota bacterium]
MNDPSASNDIDAQLKALLASGDLGRALQMAMAIVQQQPQHAEANLTLAKIRLKQGLWTEAEKTAQKVLAARPDDQEIMLIISTIHGARGQTASALDWCDQVLSGTPGSQAALRTRAQLLERAGDIQAALDILDRPELAGSDPGASMLRARCLIRNKEHAQAIQALDECLSSWNLDPSTAAAARARFLMLRAKANDALGHYDDAFADACAAKQLTPVPFNASTYAADIDQLIQTFTSEQIQPVAGYEGSQHQHVFIAGMPRSGTTLVEQILDAHPQATGVGEAKEIDICARRLQEIIGAWTPWPSCVNGLTPEFRQQLAASYEHALIQYGFEDSGTFVNKNLHNLKLLGLIAMLFPNAKVIFTHRDPRDTGVSCFMGNFSPHVHPELQTVEDVAMAIEQHHRLMDHWKSVLNLPWMDVQYEDLITDQDRITREMVEFCGLPWDDRCLQFFDSGRTVMTLSYDQVNKPMYTTSIGRYRNYEQHIEPLMKLAAD